MLKHFNGKVEYMQEYGVMCKLDVIVVNDNGRIGLVCIEIRVIINDI